MRLRVATVAVFFFALGALVSCSSSGAKESDARTAAVYEAILRSVIPADGKTDDVVWVAPFPDRKSVELETQAAVVAALADQVTIRFIDELSEATTDDPGAPAKQGFIMELGSVPSTGTTVNVDGEVYRSEQDRTPMRFHVTSVADEQWDVTTEPVPST